MNKKLTLLAAVVTSMLCASFALSTSLDSESVDLNNPNPQDCGCSLSLAEVMRNADDDQNTQQHADDDSSQHEVLDREHIPSESNEDDLKSCVITGTAGAMGGTLTLEELTGQAKYNGKLWKDPYKIEEFTERSWQVDPYTSIRKEFFLEGYEVSDTKKDISMKATMDCPAGVASGQFYAAAQSKQISYTTVWDADLDIDSRNEKYVENPTWGLDTEDDKVEHCEEEDQLGKAVMCGVFGDSDGDGTPDFADGLGLKPVLNSKGSESGTCGAKAKLVPIRVELRKPIDISKAMVKFTYPQSIPREEDGHIASVGAGTDVEPRQYYVTQAGMRIWAVDAHLRPANIETGKDITEEEPARKFVPEGKEIKWTALLAAAGASASATEVILYVEYVEAPEPDAAKLSDLAGKRKKIEVAETKESSSIAKDDVKVTLVPLQLEVDNDRDGILAMHETNDQTSLDHAYRFWLNNDQDNNADDTYNPDVDHPATAVTTDYSNTQIDQKRDLDDFTRLHLSIDGVIEQLKTGDMTLSLKWDDIYEGSPGVRVFKAVESDGGKKYLSDFATATNQVSAGSSDIGEVKGSGELEFEPSFWATYTTGKVQYLLFEAIGEGKGKMHAILKKGDVVIAKGGSLFLDLVDVRRMYERAKISSAASFPGPNIELAPSVTGVIVVDDSDIFPVRRAWDEDRYDKSYLICVHGWRKSQINARSDEITIYKRLWHRGFKGRYIGFYWPTYIGSVLTAKFNHSEYIAWKCGEAFKDYVNSLPSDYRKNAVAHSLGNVVVGSALNKGMSLSHYAMLNAAIPAQCFDPNPALKEVASTITWDTRSFYGSSTYDAWSGGDLSDDPLPALSGMGYRDKVSAVGSTNIVNFYLSNDWALQGWQANQWGDLDNIPGNDSKPIDDYDYSIGVDLKFDFDGYGARIVTDKHEAMSMVNQSMTKPAGNKSGIGGSVSDEVDLNSLGMLFGDEHEAVFKLVPSKTWIFYEKLMLKLTYVPTP